MNKMELLMKHQIEYTLRQFKDIFDFKMTSPCAQHLWDVNNEAEFFDYVKADSFHLLTTKLLYIKNRTRPDIEPVV